MSQFDKSLLKKSQPSLINRVPTYDLIEAKLYAEEIRDDKPDDSARMVKDIISWLQQHDHFKDKQMIEIERARQIALEMRDKPDECVKLASLLTQKLDTIITNRNNESIT